MQRAEGVSLAELEADSAKAERETGVRPTLTYTNITCEHTSAVLYTLPADSTEAGGHGLVSCDGMM